MNQTTNMGVALLVGVVVAGVVGIGVTALLATRIWPSLFVGIPVGIAAGCIAGFVVWRRLR